jgi:hypothetical protein
LQRKSKICAWRLGFRIISTLGFLDKCIAKKTVVTTHARLSKAHIAVSQKSPLGNQMSKVHSAASQESPLGNQMSRKISPSPKVIFFFK